MPGSNNLILGIIENIRELFCFCGRKWEFIWNVYRLWTSREIYNGHSYTYVWWVDTGLKIRSRSHGSWNNGSGWNFPWKVYRKRKKGGLKYIPWSSESWHDGRRKMSLQKKQGKHQRKKKNSKPTTQESVILKKPGEDSILCIRALPVGQMLLKSEVRWEETVRWVSNDVTADNLDKSSEGMEAADGGHSEEFGWEEKEARTVPGSGK